MAHRAGALRAAASTRPEVARTSCMGMAPVASKLVVKKLLTNTLLPAPMSQTPPLQVKNCVSIASGGGVPVPVPVSGAVCGLPGALSVTLSVAVTFPMLWA